jgi:hypothetical protein
MDWMFGKPRGWRANGGKPPFADDMDDPHERERVYGKIAPLILAFASEHAGQPFHAEELRRYVLQRAPEIAPASPDRILRVLRQEGKIDYVVINRRQSLYLFRFVPPRLETGGNDGLE